MASNEIDTELTDSQLLHQLKHDSVSLQQLEFPRIIEQLQQRLATPYGFRHLATINFSRHADVVREELQKSMEMLALLEGGYPPPISGFTDITPHLDKIKPVDAYLETDALLDIKYNLQSLIEVRLFFDQHRDEAPLLQKYAQRIHMHRDIIGQIEGTIDRSGEIFDNASPELRQVRIKIRTMESDHKKALVKIQKQYADYLQDGIVTLRDGRQVLGIQPNYVNKVNGIVHGTSSSGATIFVEPMETLKISNEIQNLRIRERVEIIKILKFLTGIIRQVRNVIYFSLENIAILDVILAKARLGNELEGSAPKITETAVLRIFNGRHPLLLLKTGREKVVPLSVKLGENIQTLVITGPNAGGKTVAMKTVGLLVLMTQMGIPIPADPDSEIPLVDKILVDIGDRQSLEQDLSTFSAHVVRLKQIVEEAGDRTLVLLDEVGTGTDPKEGAALAIALLSELTDKKALTIATTHHGELKAFAHENQSVENASMEFDLQTLAPTYRLRVGVPGSSYAIEIARRYGFPENLILAAKTYIGEEKDRLEELILSLESRLQIAEKERREANIKLTKAEALQNLYERQLDDYKKNKAARKQEAEVAALKILQEANALIEKTVQEIRESQGEKAVIKHARSTVQKQRTRLEKSLQPDLELPKPEEPLQKGDRVWVDSLNDAGELLDDPEGKKKVRVLVGNVTLTVDRNGIRRSNKSPKKEKAARTITGADVDATSGTTAVTPELDLRGLDQQDAIDETDRYLSQALESGWEEVRIVHGKGSGVLRVAINNYLSRDKRVESKRLGRWGEGDTGVTVVKLRYA
ncbi:MAG: endonuclease MutS2 [Calditrichia bacterium]